MGIKLEGQRKKYKIASMAILLAGACFVTYYFHGVLEVETVFTHSFYVPIILASIWWRRKGLVVAIFLAAILLLSHFLLIPNATPAGDYLRATMFVAISFVVGMLSDRIAKAHQATKLTHAELDRIFNTSGDAMCVIDKDFNVLRINKTFLSLSGVSEDEAAGKKCHELFGGPLCHTAGCPLTRILSGEEHVEYEEEKERNDGIRIPCIVTATPLRGPDGKLIGIIEDTKDITERKQAQDKLKRQEQELQTILDSVPALISYKDRDRRHIRVNKALADATGIPKEHWIGKTVSELLPGFTEHYDPHDIEVLASGQPKIDIIQELRTMNETRWTRMDKIPYKDEEGNVIGIIGLSIDITERKRAEEALQESEERYRLIAENVTDVIWVVDANMQLTYVSPSVTRLRGYSVEEAMAQRFEEWLTPTSLEVVAKILAEEGATENQGRYPSRPRTMELELTCKDGSTVWTELRMADMLDQDGKPVGTMGVSRDISERKRMEEERESLLEDLNRINARLAQSNKELQDFVYVASHDLREPLRKMASFGNLLQDSLEGNLDEDQQENLEFMIDGANRMQMMIDDLLTYSRVSTKAKPPEHVDLNEVIENLKKLELAVQLDETKGTIRIPRSLPPVSGDPSQIHQLLQNLIGNGLKFHRDGIPPEITIRARQVQKNMVRVEVQDNGIGIDEQYHEQVFTMFKRLHSRTDYEGTGIGLAVCKKIVDRHGGEIGVKSTPGECSTFWLTLPRGSYS